MPRRRNRALLPRRERWKLNAMMLLMTGRAAEAEALLFRRPGRVEEFRRVLERGCSAELLSAYDEACAARRARRRS